jgi:putative ABC transport system permease protein
MAMAATFLPARRAGRRAPLKDLLDRTGAQDDTHHWPSYVGLALLALGAVLVCGFLRRWFSPSLSLTLLGLTNAICLVGAVLTIPLFHRPLIKLAALLLEPLLGVECRLAIRQLDRHRGRTALTAGVLLVAIVFAIGFGNSLLNIVRDMHDWLERVADMDFYIRAVWPDPTTLVTAAPLSESLADEIKSFDGVERVDKFNWIPARAEGRPVLVLARTYAADAASVRLQTGALQPDGSQLALDLVEGEPSAVLRGLLAGEVVLGTTFAQRSELSIGDEVSLDTRRGPQSLRIAGTTTEWTVGGMAIHMDWSTAQRLFEMNGVHNFLVKARPGAAPVLAGELKAFAQELGLLFQSYSELRVALDRQMQGFLGSIWVLMSLVFVVASMGIVNTLTMNVLEQTRELGVLRALGMKRVEVGKMIISQAIALGMISLVPGTVVGIGLALLMNVATYPIVGVPIDLSLDLPLVFGCFVVAFVIGVAAAVLPAWRAARLHVIRAIQYE